MSSQTRGGLLFDTERETTFLTPVSKEASAAQDAGADLTEEGDLDIEE